MRYFLYRFETSGMRNIANNLTLDFHDAAVPKSLDFSRTNVKAIYGTNGSGKTSILLSLLLAKNIATNSRYLPISDDYLSSHLSFLGIPFRAKTYFACYDEENENRVIDVLTYEIMLRFESNHWNLVEEKIGKISGNSINRNEKVLFEARDGEIIVLPSGIEEKTRSNVKEKFHNLLFSSSLVSRFDSLDELPELKKAAGIVNSFFGSLSIFVEDQNAPFSQNDLLSSTEAMKKAVDAIEKAQSKLPLNLFDFLGADIVVEKSQLPAFRETVSHLRDFILLFKPSLKDIRLDEKEAGDYFACKIAFVYDGYSVDLSLESKGIRRIVSLFGNLEAVAKGGIGFFDEIDASIHEVYLEKLVAFFASYSKGQFVFTSQSLAPMRALESSKHAIDFLSDQGRHEEWTRHGRYRASRLYPEGMIAGNPFNVDDYTFYRIFFDKGERK